MKVYAVTDVGSVRPLNEDSFCLPNDGEHFCAVADGMGGHNAGEVASRIAAETFAEAMRSGASLYDAVSRANTEVYRASQADRSRSGMGTTFSAISAGKGRVSVAHVGDSRVYRIRDEVIVQLTSDHTWVEMMVMAGRLTPEQARSHPKRHLITRAVGVGEQVDIDLFDIDAKPGDVYLLCSDGLCGSVSDDKLLDITCGDGSWEEKLRALVSRAIQCGSTDNITALYAVLEEDDA